jgi:hypothetical protein
VQTLFRLSKVLSFIRWQNPRKMVLDDKKRVFQRTSEPFFRGSTTVSKRERLLEFKKILQTSLFFPEYGGYFQDL